MSARRARKSPSAAMAQSEPDTKKAAPMARTARRSNSKAVIAVFAFPVIATKGRRKLPVEHEALSHCRVELAHGVALACSTLNLGHARLYRAGPTRAPA